MISLRNLVIVALAAGVIGLGVLAWQQHGELAARRETAVNPPERAEMQKRLWDAEKRWKELAAELASERAKFGADSDLATSGGTGNATGGAVRGERRGPGLAANAGGLNGLMNLMEKPELQRLLALQQKAQLDGKFAGLFRNLRLPAAELEQLKSLMVEKQTALQDVITAGHAQGLDPLAIPQELGRMVASTQADVEGNIKALLGEANYEKYHAYEQTAPQRNVVSQLEQSLSYTNSPLTEAQSEQLVQVLARTTPLAEDPGNALATGPQMNFAVSIGGEGGVGARGSFLGVGASAPITDEAVTQAQSFLAPEQVQGLQQLQQQQQAQQQLQQTLRQSFGRGPGPAAETPANANAPNAIRPNLPRRG